MPYDIYRLPDEDRHPNPNFGNIHVKIHESFRSAAICIRAIESDNRKTLIAKAVIKSMALKELPLVPAWKKLSNISELYPKMLTTFY